MRTPDRSAAPNPATSTPGDRNDRSIGHARPEPARATDHGRPLSPRRVDGRRGDGADARSPQLLRRPRHAPRSRGQGRGFPPRGRPALRLPPGGRRRPRAEVRAPAPGRHVLRRLRRARRGRAPPDVGDRHLGRRDRPPRGARRRGAGGGPMTPLATVLDVALKGSALLGVTAALVFSLRRAPASVRHLAWSAGMGGLVALPLLSLALPWRFDVLPVDRLGLSAPAAEPAGWAPVGEAVSPSASPSATVESSTPVGPPTGDPPILAAGAPSWTPTGADAPAEGRN